MAKKNTPRKYRIGEPIPVSLAQAELAEEKARGKEYWDRIREQGHILAHTMGAYHVRRIAQAILSNTSGGSCDVRGSGGGLTVDGQEDSVDAGVSNGDGKEPEGEHPCSEHGHLIPLEVHLNCHEDNEGGSQ